MDNKRIALVTGANKGIGLEIARQLAEAGVTVIIGSRDAGRGEAAVTNLAAHGLAATCLQLDVTDETSIAAAAAAISAEHGRLDILVNNAGIFDFADAAPNSASIAAVRKVLETNFIGALAVTQAMLPLLRKSPAGRCVSAWNKDPANGVIGVQTGPPSAMGLQQPPVSSEAFYLDACCGDNSEDTSAFPCAGQDDQGDLPGVGCIAESGAEGSAQR